MSYVQRNVQLISKPQTWRTILFIFASCVAVYGVVLNFGQVREGLMGIRTARPEILLLALVCIAGTFMTATSVYWFLSSRILVYISMFKMEVAGGFTSHLLPAGLGGIATNLRYLSRVFGSKTQAIALIALNNILSFLSFVTAAIVVALLTHQPISSIIRLRFSGTIIVFAIALLLLCSAAGLHSKKLQRKIHESLIKLKGMLSRYRHKPQFLAGAFLGAVGTTVLYITTLFLCGQALGAHISFLQAFIAFTLGITGAAITPTPGGLGGVELGLYTGLYSTGVSSVDALAIALTYRLIAFWLPLIPGFFMFRHLLKTNML